MPTFFGKDVPDPIGVFPLNNAANLQFYPSGRITALTDRYNYDESPVCANAGLGSSKPMNQPTRHEGSLVAKAYGQNPYPTGPCYFPRIEDGALVFDVPNKSQQGVGGYVDFPIDGIGPAGMSNLAHRVVGPHTGNGEIWIRFLCKQEGVDLLGGSVPDAMKFFILGPMVGYQNGTATPSMVMQRKLVRNKENLFEGYNYAASHPNGSTYIQPWDRTINGQLYWQSIDGVGVCPYSTPNPIPVPPCVTFPNDRWVEILMCFEFRPAATDFTISGARLSKPGFFTGVDLSWFFGFPGPWSCYIKESKEWRYLTVSGPDDAMLDEPATDGTNRTVYIANLPRHRWRVWLDGVIVSHLNDCAIFWEHFYGFQGFGQIRILNQTTNKDGSIAHAPGKVSYKELIIAGDGGISLATDGSTPHLVLRMR